MPTTTLAQAEDGLAHLPRALAGLETALADELAALLGTGEAVTRALGLARAAAVIERLRTGEAGALRRLDAGEAALAHLGEVAESVTPAALAAVVLPKLDDLKAVYDRAAALMARTPMGTPLSTLVHHHRDQLVWVRDQVAHLDRLGAPAAGLLGLLPVVGSAVAALAAANGVLRLVEPELARVAAPAAAPADPAALAAAAASQPGVA